MNTTEERMIHSLSIIAKKLEWSQDKPDHIVTAIRTVGHCQTMANTIAKAYPEFEWAAAEFNELVNQTRMVSINDLIAPCMELSSKDSRSTILLVWIFFLAENVNGELRDPEKEKLAKKLMGNFFSDAHRDNFELLGYDNFALLGILWLIDYDHFRYRVDCQKLEENECD
ncbi:hypothetical protein NRIC_09360 [Enterococcus florum]|uniref:Uncharacterized protein n=1 Tax=Enterococcus florum TaxID=2480627 RepID=A0A4P5P5D9_9ENTE|nr:hypothetical protein [Enterococcus florum]GCF93045.1 hypothetical protein NRIC_09360 [Enterococcus florum]